MLFRNCFVFLPLMLSGCGVSLYAHDEYITLSEVNDVKIQERKMFSSRGFCYRKVYSNQDKEYITERKEFEKGNFRISFAESSGGLVGLSPLIPLPPYMPIFLDNTNPVCPVETDLQMSIRYVAGNVEDDLEIRERLNFPDVNKIYLIKEDGQVVLPRHVWDNGYSYQVCFPLKPEEANASVLVVGGLTDKQGKQLYIKPQRLRYYNDYRWGVGGLASCMSENLNAELKEEKLLQQR